jgi:CubicO group peptidase (beta-lactamase class C family)
MRSWLVACSVIVAGLVLAAQPPVLVIDDPTPQSLDQFKAAAAKVLEETGVPGAGLALVTVDGTEWAGGIGWADRDARVPVTADTHFRAGSISKSFVAMALVQLYEDGKLDLDAKIADLLPDVVIDNSWGDAAPITVRQVLEHTAGFDDMHFNEVYVLGGGPDMSLFQVLRVFAAPRHVRWRPGTRMSYSNPGYAVAGMVIETLAGMPYDQFIQQRTFAPLEMKTSTFQLSPENDPALAKGYRAASGPPVTPYRIHLRPAGALITSAGELAHFVEALLGWGERKRGGYIVDPEYLSNMEWPRTTLANRAGVRSGYGLGIHSTVTLPYHVLGHNGGIHGFLSSYGYSPSRDVGYVVLINSTHAPQALTRLSSLAIRYMKRDVEPPPKPRLTVTPDVLRTYEGYYRDLSPRNEILRPVRVVTDGRTVRLEGDRLVLDPDFGDSVPLVPVETGLFRREHEIDATLAFTEDEEGRAILTGPGVYAERTARWPVTVLRAGLALAVAMAVVAPIAALVRWRRLRRLDVRAETFRGLGLIWAAALALLALGALALRGADAESLGQATLQARSLYIVSIAYPALAAVALIGAAWGGLRRGGRPGYALMAWIAGAAHAGIATYLAWWGLVAFRSWTY